MDKQLKHLEMIQNVINRMANCSFLLKGWSVILVAGLMAVSVASQEKLALISIAFVPLIVFWILDGYYLSQERRFRAIYDEVRKKQEQGIDFSMDTSAHKHGKYSLFAAMLSRTVFAFYASLIVVMTGVIIFLVLSTGNNI